jgi:phage portal protein BeeE
VDSELINQMKWSDERICSAYHVPPYMVGVGDWPPYANTEPALQAYFSQCIQSHLRKFELCLDRGLGIDEKIEGKQYGTEFDIDDLIWMDNTTRVESAQKAILGGSSPNEVRKKYHGSGPVAGGEMPYLQEQNWPLSLLAARELPTRQPTAPAELPPAEDDDEVIDMAATWAALRQKSLEVGLYGA